MAGSLPTQPLQNTFYGLPLVLLPEEVHLLHQRGKADNLLPITRRQSNNTQYGQLLPLVVI